MAEGHDQEHTSSNNIDNVFFFDIDPCASPDIVGFQFQCLQVIEQLIINHLGAMSKHYEISTRRFKVLQNLAEYGIHRRRTISVVFVLEIDMWSYNINTSVNTTM